MSHVAAIDLFVTDLDAIEDACTRLGLVLMRGQTTYTWFGQWQDDYNDPQRAAAMKGYDPSLFGRCEHAIRRADHKAGQYEIGLVKRPDGKPGYSLVFDNFASGTYFASKFGGADLPELKEHYGASLAEQHWARKGYVTSRQYSTQGKLQVVATKRS